MMSLIGTLIVGLVVGLLAAFANPATTALAGS
jgi:uncharacterized membrane protein YeaQ/YmgE (transglycosylase-associated protein family)